MRGFISIVGPILIPGLVAGLTASFSAIGVDRTMVGIYSAIRKSLRRAKRAVQSQHDDYKEALADGISPPVVNGDSLSFSVRYGDGAVRDFILKPLNDNQVILYDSERSTPVYLSASSTREAANKIIEKVYMGRKMTRLHSNFKKAEKYARTGR